MLERETDTILSTLRERTIGEGDSILLRDVLVCEIPRGIKTYMQAETVRALSQELFALPRFSRIERDASGVWRLAHSFLTSMAEGYCFSKEEFLVLLENAVHFLENYLCRPQWTLESFVFEGVPRVAVVDMLDKLESIVDYGYFRTLITRVVRRRQSKELGIEEFRAMLMTIDDQIVKQHNARELALLAKPIFDFLLLRDTPPDVAVPLKPVLVFFEDKKMKILREYIESICRIRERSTITLDELTALVEDLYLGHPESAPEETPKEAVPEEAQEEPAPSASLPLIRLDPTWVESEDTEPSDTAQKETPLEPEQSDFAEPEQPTFGVPQVELPEADQPLPTKAEIEASEAPAEQLSASGDPGALDTPIQDELTEPEPPELLESMRRGTGPASPEITPPEEVSPTAPKSEPPEHIESPSIFEYVTEEPDGFDDRSDDDLPRRAGQEPFALRDLHEFIKGHFRNRFIRRIFHRDEEHFENVIAALNDAPTWKEASLLLKKLYVTNGLDPFDADVVEFTDTVHHRYVDADGGTS